MPGIVGPSRSGTAMARRKRRGNASARNMDRWRERSSRHRDMCAVPIPETRGASAWPSPAARAVRACLARDAAGAWIVQRTAFSFPVPLGYWLEGGGGTRGAAGPAPSRRRLSRTAVRAGEGRTLGSGSDERVGAFDGSGANGRTAAGCGERASCCPHALHTTRQVAHRRTRRCGHRRALYVPAGLHSPVEMAGDRIWTGRGSGLSSGSMARRAGNEMACIGNAPHGQGGEMRTANARRVETTGVCGGVRAGTTAQRLKMHVKTIAWCCFQVTRVAVGRSRLTRDNWRYRESIANSSPASCNRAASAHYTPAIRGRAIPYCNLLIQWTFFASEGAPGARRRR